LWTAHAVSEILCIILVSSVRWERITQRGGVASIAGKRQPEIVDLITKLVSVAGKAIARQRIFIGSSQQNVTVARLIRDRLEVDHSINVRIWDEGVFGVGQGILERLVAEVGNYDFAVLVWGEDDITESKGESRASPRDNVIFECGLFIGAIGRDRIFIVRDLIP